MNRGHLEITTDLVYSEDPEVQEELQKVFGNLIIVKAEEEPFRKVIKYWALSNKFRKCDPPEVVPYYMVIISRTEEATKISFQEVGDHYCK